MVTVSIYKNGSSSLVTCGTAQAEGNDVEAKMDITDSSAATYKVVASSTDSSGNIISTYITRDIEAYNPSSDDDTDDPDKDDTDDKPIDPVPTIAWLDKPYAQTEKDVTNSNGTDVATATFKVDVGKQGNEYHYRYSVDIDSRTNKILSYKISRSFNATKANGIYTYDSLSSATWEYVGGNAGTVFTVSANSFTDDAWISDDALKSLSGYSSATKAVYRLHIYIDENPKPVNQMIIVNATSLKP